MGYELSAMREKYIKINNLSKYYRIGKKEDYIHCLKCNYATSIYKCQALSLKDFITSEEKSFCMFNKYILDALLPPPDTVFL